MIDPYVSLVPVVHIFEHNLILLWRINSLYNSCGLLLWFPLL